MKFKGINVTQLVKTSRVVLRQNAPVILSVTAAVGAIATAVLGVRAGVKAGVQIAEIEGSQSQEDNRTAPARFADRASHTWKLFLPTAAVALTTATCAVMANKISMQRAAALASAYALSDRAFAEYREKVLETVGVKKAEKIDEAADQQSVLDNSVPSQIIISDGKMMMFDKFTSRYFTSDMESLNQALAKANFAMAHEGHISLNEWYTHAGIEGIPIGDELGWSRDHGLLEYRLTSQLSDDHRPVMVVSFNRTPGTGYASFR